MTTGLERGGVAEGSWPPARAAAGSHVPNRLSEPPAARLPDPSAARPETERGAGEVRPSPRSRGEGAGRRMRGSAEVHRWIRQPAIGLAIPQTDARSPPPRTPPHKGEGVWIRPRVAPNAAGPRHAGALPPPCGEGYGVGVRRCFRRRTATCPRRHAAP